MSDIQRQIVDDLHSLGFRVATVSDLFNENLDYRRAIPTLLEWLPKTYDPDEKEELVRALSVKVGAPRCWAGALAGILACTRRSLAAEVGYRKRVGSGIRSVDG